MIAQVNKQLVTARMEDATTGHLHTHEDGTKFSVDGEASNLLGAKCVIEAATPLGVPC
jgi:hypothetical protein